MGLSGLEPPTSRLSGGRSNRLSYKPILVWLKHRPPAYQADALTGWAISPYWFGSNLKPIVRKLSNLVALRCSVNSFNSSNLFRRCLRLHSLVLAVRYFRASSLGSSFWWRYAGSNRRPPACKAGALPAELYPHIFSGTEPWKLNNKI